MISKPQKPIGEDDLLAFVDRQLSTERAAEVEQHLKRFPDVAARIAADRKLAEELRDGMQGLADAPLPLPLRIASLRAGMRLRRHRQFTQIAAAALLLAIGGVAGWLIKPPGAASPDTVAAFLAQATEAHRTFVVEVAHPVEVEAAKMAHLTTWLGNRLQHQITIPDLSAAGLALEGGRVLPGPAGPAAQLMYRTGDGVRVTLYVGPGDGEASGLSWFGSGDLEAFYWADGDLAYALSAEAVTGNLREMAQLAKVGFGTD